MFATVQGAWVFATLKGVCHTQEKLIGSSGSLVTGQANTFLENWLSFLRAVSIDVMVTNLKT